METKQGARIRAASGVGSPSREKQIRERLAVFDTRVQETFKLDPQVPLTLGKKELTLVFNNWAVKEVLKDTGVNLLMGLEPDKFSDPTVFGSILLRGVQTHHPEMTMEEMDKLITFRHFPYLQERVRTALEMFYPDLSDLPMQDEDEVVAIRPEADPT